MSIPLPAPVQQSVWIDISRIDLPDNPRYHSDEEIDAMAKSLDNGQLAPIIVVRITFDGGPLAGEGAVSGIRYEAVAGICRLLAASKKSWRQIRADVYEGLSKLQKLMITFTENEDRKNASPLYQSQMLKGMMEDAHLTQEDLSGRLGKTQQNLSQYLSLLKLSPRIWGNTNRFVNLGLAHFMQLLRIENDDDQWKVAETTADNALSVDALQAMIDKRLGVKRVPKKTGRPKGAGSLNPGGIQIGQKGTILTIKTKYDRAGELESFVTHFKDELVNWLAAHPAKTNKTAPNPGSKSDGDAASHIEPEAKSQEQVSGTPAPAVLPAL